MGATKGTDSIIDIEYRCRSLLHGLPPHTLVKIPEGVGGQHVAHSSLMEMISDLVCTEIDSQIAGSLGANETEVYT